MAKARANGIEIEWDARGPEGAPAILLIMGLGGQMTRWSDATRRRAFPARGWSRSPAWDMICRPR